jgi:hypothetical protein
MATMHPDSRERLKPAADALAGVLRSIKIATTTNDFNNSSTNNDTFHLLVGVKM